jgi:FAD synthase
MIRVGATSANGSYVPRCRVDHGVAAGVTSLGTQTKLAAGTIELLFRDVTGDVYALAAYTFEAGRELCPAAVIR